jgi:hypothetical protein
MTVATRETEDAGAGLEPIGRSDARLEGLRRAALELATWRRASEGDFLVLGDLVSEAHDRLRRALDAMTALGAAVLAEEGDRAIAVMHALGAEATRLEVLNRERREGLVRLHATAGAMRRVAADIIETLRVLEQLGLLARIDVATLDGADKADLGSFVSEVTNLLIEGRRTADDMARRLGRLDDALGQTTLLAASLDGAHRRSLREIAVRLDGLAGELDAYQRATRVAAAEIGGQFDAIWRAVADVVRRIQFQDAARQRLEHVSAGIERLLHVAERGRLLDDGELLSPGRCAHAIGAIAALEATQLRRLAADLASEAQGLRDNLAAIGGSVAEAERRLRQAHAGGGGGDGGGSVLATLDRNVQVIGEAFAGGETTRKEVDAAVERCVGDARHLEGVAAILEELELALRLTGLNAAVRAARVGGGAHATRCIAQEIRAQAGAIAAHAATFQQDLGALLSIVRGLAEKVLPGLQACQRTVGEGVRENAGTLNGIEAAAREQHAAALEGTAGLAASLRRRAEAFTVDREGCRLMQAVARHLEGIATAAAGAAAGEEPWPELDQLLRGLYTMQREREVHDGREAPAREATASTVDDLADVLF